jgi:TolB-like protein/DNA-binding winged helix-turn-helix (wHTH) protein/Tfp pilus assembly protein PilF
MSKRVKQLYEFGPFRLDPAEHTLLRDGRPIPLRPKVFDILLVLIENHGHLVEKEELMSLVWTEQFVEEGNLNKNISMLRRALGEDAGGHKFIETIPKRGYRFVADVREVNDSDEADSVMDAPATSRIISAEDPSSGSQQIHEYPASASRPSQVRTQPFNRNWIPFLVVLAVLLAAVVYLVFVRERRPSLSPTITSIVVLPLQNLSGDPAQEYFVDGMTDALIGDLAKIGALRVISRTSAMHYKGTHKSLSEIAKELNVDAVVEGAMQRSGDRVSIRARLIHAGADRQLWSESYERDFRDALGMQREIARAIAREVQAKLTPAEQTRLANSVMVNRKALDNYLQGRYLLDKAGQLPKAIEYLQSAIKEDPTYAPAYAGLAACYNLLGSVQVGALPPPEARRLAEDAAVKARQLDGSLAEAHAALGWTYLYNWNWAAAEQELKRAIELNPNSAEAHNIYAFHLSAIGRAEEAIAEANHAQELDPLSLFISTQRGFALTNARRYDEAIEQFRRVIVLDPNDYRPHLFLAIAYASNNRFAEAVARSERAVVLSSRAPSVLGTMGMCYGLAGRKVEARKTLEELLELNRRRYVTPVAMVHVYIGLGDKDRSFAWLEKGYQERSYFMAYIKVIPLVDPLRTDPRFDDLLRRMGLPQ